MPPLSILRSSPASRPPWRHVGGGRRAAQIAEILAGAGILSHSSDAIQAPAFGRLELLRAALHLRLGEPRIRFRADRDIIRHLASDYLRHRWFFAHHPQVRVFLIENCTDYAQIRAARDAGVHLVSLPPNFETWQTPEQADFYSGEPMPASLHREVTFAAQSDAVFCISREEQWYLANYGAAADYLPYHPPAEDLAQLQSLRARRAVRDPGNHELLTVTTATNLKNRDALVALAGLLRELPADSRLTLHVGGRGTEALREMFPTDRCVFHGELSDQALADLMVRCHATVIFQPSGVGALTRVPESLCAGLPVLANAHAARSWHGVAGVHVFHDAAELAALALRPCAMPPAPAPDAAAGRRLTETIRRLAGS